MDKNVATWKDSILQSHNTLQKQKTKKSLHTSTITHLMVLMGIVIFIHSQNTRKFIVRP